MYCAPWLTAPVVIEIDGAGHRRREGADKARDAAIAASGLRTDRFSGGAALDEAAKPLATLLAHGVAKPSAPVDQALLRLLYGPAEPSRIGLAIVEGVLGGFLRPGRPWTLEMEDEIGLASELAGVALDPLRAISDLWGSHVVPDEVVVNGTTWRLGGGRATRRSGGLDGSRDLSIRLEPTTPYFAQLPERGPGAMVVVRGVGVPVDLSWSPALRCDRTNVPKTADVSEALHLLVTDLFGHEGFRDGQLAAIRQVLAGEDSVVLLPTGSGKSLIYQLAGLVTPGTTIVVDPLVSLIDDQAERLSRDGIDRVSALHATRLEAPGEGDRLLNAVGRADALFVFATPERFQSRRFRDQLTAVAERELVGTLVVDEAHCVSEWGHDFRTSYLRLARTLRSRCRDHSGAPPPLLALTGTASPAVLRDVLRELEIDETADGALQRPDSHDRCNLTYEKRRSTDEAWVSDVEAVLLERLPGGLRVPVEAMARCAGPETISGIVFTPHVNGRYGAREVSEKVRAAFLGRDVRIDTVVYSGGAPDGHEIGWDTEKAISAHRFKANDVPLLIGTKAFGMGIDKPNIRYTIHAGMPSSLEAFAQEAGRAGRNGATAFCTLVAVLPQSEIAESVLSQDLSAEERKALVDRILDKQGGDVRRQAWFLTNSFPGVAEEVRRALETLAQLGVPPPPRSVMTIPLPRAFGVVDRKARRRVEDRRSEVDRALYRLAMAGVIGDLTVDGTEATVHIADWTNESLDAALLEYLARIEPGRAEVQRSEVLAAPTDALDRIGHHVAMLIGATYRIVARARLQALRFMYETASGPDDPQWLRERINSYLGGGPVAMVLSDAVRAPTINVRRFVLAMESIALREQDDLVASTARQLEAYPEHPVLLLASSLGEARLPDADRGRFRRRLAESMAQFVRYGVDENEAAVGAQWLSRLLQKEDGGRRSGWLVDILRMWDEAGHSSVQLTLIENAILEDAIRHGTDPDAAVFVRSRRLRRHAAAAAVIANRLAGPDSTISGGGE